MQLARDDAGPARGPDRRADALHWAPLRRPGPARAGWRRSRRGSRRTRPRLLVVDVSVEVAVLRAADGRPDRRDGAARATATTPRTSSGYRARRRDPRALAGGLGGHGRAACARWRATGRTRSARSRASPAAARPRRPARPRRRVLVLRAAAARQLRPGDRRGRAAARRPAGTWTVLGPPGRAGSPTRGRCCARADVVVTHAGPERARRRRRGAPPRGGHPADRAARRAARHRPRARRRRPRRRLRALAGRRRVAGLLARALAARLGWAALGRRTAPPSAPPGSSNAVARRSALPAVRVVRVAVITIVAGRHEHLRLQRRGLRRSTRRSTHHVVVCMGDGARRTWLPPRPSLAATRGRRRACAGLRRLPLARARNAGAERALDVRRGPAGVPRRRLHPRARHAAAVRRRARARTGAALLCGPVAYLPPPPPGGYDLDRLGELADAAPGPARPARGRDRCAAGTRAVLVAVVRASRPRPGSGSAGSARTTSATAARTPTSASSPRPPASAWTGSAAPAPTTSTTRPGPAGRAPGRHPRATRALFFRRWGWWPMAGWLTEFQRLGLAYFDPTDGWRRGSRGDG